MHSLADGRSISIKKADKVTSVVVQDRNDHVIKAEKQLIDTNVYKNVTFNEKILQDLKETNNIVFPKL